MKKRIKKIIFTFLFILLSLIMILYLIVMFSSKQLDDVSPKIQCDKELLEKSDVLYVIPKFDNISISENKSWCEYILSLNKTLAIHGVYHNYQEFKENKDQEYLDSGIKIFEECFNKSPSSFKAPQLAISKENKDLIKRNLKFDGYFNQIFHKVYHCSDTGMLKNKFIDWL
jgi:predicted deacetylase